MSEHTDYMVFTDFIGLQRMISFENADLDQIRKAKMLQDLLLTHMSKKNIRDVNSWLASHELPIISTDSLKMHWSSFGYHTACGKHLEGSRWLTRTPHLITCKSCRKSLGMKPLPEREES
jgi:hypothetical protein